MLKGYKHTISCKCGETVKYFEPDQYDDMEKEMTKGISTCCKTPFEYLGLRPYYENILKIPTEDDIPVIPEEDFEVKGNSAISVIETHQPKAAEETKQTVQPFKAAAITVTDNTTSKTTLKVEDIIQPGPSGVTNKQMIPALKELITNGEIDKINLLRETYSDVFEGSLKYVGKKLVDRLKDLS